MISNSSSPPNLSSLLSDALSGGATRRAGAALAVLGALVALPAAANAAGTASGGPARVAGGYAVTLTAVDAKKDTVTIGIDRGTQADGQTEMVVVTRGARVKVGRGTASVNGSLGSRGKVAMRLVAARSTRGRALPKGCVGTLATSLTGRLEGKLRLKLPNGKRVTILSMPAVASTGRNELRCERGSSGRGDGGDGDGQGDDGEPRLMLSTRSGNASVSFIATKTALMLTRSAEPKRERGATVSTLAIVRASGSNLLTVSGGGASAGVKSAGAFAGAGAFTAAMVAGPFAQGPLTGSLMVKVGAAPPIGIAGDDAILLNGDKG